jgi:3-oxoacyl-[acyl-carrier-protein] synthase II
VARAHRERYRDHLGRPLVAITGIGVVTCLGVGVRDTWARLTAGQSGIRPITRFPTDGLRTTIAGTVELPGAPYAAADLATAIAETAAREAVAQAGIGARNAFPGRLIIATPPSELEWPHMQAIYRGAPEGAGEGYARLLAGARSGAFRDLARDLARHVRFASIAARLQERIGTRGAPLSVCTACASGATTIQLATEAIRRGDLAAALCVGTDATVHPEGLIRFSLLSALSTRNETPERASRPFAKDRDGFVMAEGAGALVLEDYRHARARGAPILGIVRGCGEKADHHHRTRSDPSGAAIVGAIRKTLTDAGLAPEAIDHINAHGTSTPENDKMEYVSLKAVLGERLGEVPISANKSMVGHTLIAAGAVEAVLSVMTLQTGTLPPTINYDIPDPELPLDVVANVKRDAAVRTVLSNSFGFGGQNVCLALSAEPA